jgi:hypothetical protein
VTESPDESEISKDTDTYKGDIPARLPTRLVKDLSDISGLRTTAALLSEWGAILAAVVLYQQFSSLFLFPVVVM